MIYLLALFFLIVVYVVSCFGCISYLIDKYIEPNIFSILIAMCPILNTYLAFKNVNFKDTINKLK